MQMYTIHVHYMCAYKHVHTCTWMRVGVGRERFAAEAELVVMAQSWKTEAAAEVVLFEEVGDWERDHEP